MVVFLILSEHEHDHYTPLTYLTSENIKTNEKIGMGKRDVRDLKKIYSLFLAFLAFTKDHEI